MGVDGEEGGSERVPPHTCTCMCTHARAHTNMSI